MKVSARLLLGFFLFFLSLTSLVSSPVLAQSTDYSLNTNSDVPENSHTRTQVMLIDLSAALICQLSGIDVINPSKGCLGIDPVTNKIGYVQDTTQNQQVGGLLGLSSTMIGNLYTPPASTMESVSYLANNFGIAKTAMAQENDGYDALSPLQSLWILARNLVFLILVIVFVLIGIGIMLRLKIDPRTVMSIQNQLPKIIVAIVLITFSYSIVGFMIDLMWTGTYLVINTLGPSAPEGTVGQATSNLYNNPIYYVNDLFKDGSLGDTFMIAKISQDIGFTIGDVVSGIILSVLGAEGNIGDNCGVSNGLKSLGNALIPGGDPFGEQPSLGECVEAAFFNVLAFFIGILAMLIVLFAILIALFRVWFTLLKSYVYVILYTILAPFFILFGLLPNSTLSFSSWIRRVSANLLAFPAVVALFVVAKIFLDHEQLNNPDTAASAFVPPLIGNPNIGNNIGTLIAFGIILIAPSIVDIIKDALKAQGNSKVAAAVTGGFAAGVGPGLAPIRGPLKSLSRWDPRTQEAGALGALTHHHIPNAIRGGARRIPGVRRFAGGENALQRGRRLMNP